MAVIFYYAFIVKVFAAKVHLFHSLLNKLANIALFDYENWRQNYSFTKLAPCTKICAINVKSVLDFAYILSIIDLLIFLKVPSH